MEQSGDASPGVPVETPEPPAHPFRLLERLLIPGVLLLIGMLMVSGAAFMDANAARQQPWASAVMVLDVPAGSSTASALTDAIPMLAQRTAASEDALASIMARSEEGRSMAAALDLDKGPIFLAFQEKWSDVASLLAEGRMPEPGSYEVLAGHLASSTPFEFGGKTFTVTGRLHPSIGALGYAYLAPNTEAVRQALHATGPARQGWLLPKGFTRAMAKELAAAKGTPPEFVLLPGRSPERVIWLCFSGMVLVSIGGCAGYIHVLRWLATWWRGLVAAPLLQSMSAHMLPFIGIHALLYGVFFQAMAMGVLNPLLQTQTMQFVQHMFSEGGLSYVGSAYARGSIIGAAAATFLQNFFVATIAATLAPSVAIPFFGIVKNMGSFGFAGFAMAPVWFDAAPRMSYHCLTMVLEFEAYAVATFAAAMWPVTLYRGLRDGAFGAGLVHGLRILAGAVLVSGAMLLLAAVYEASTLILLGGA